MKAILLPRRYQPIETTKIDPLSILQELDGLLKSIEKKIESFSKSLETNKIKNEINDVSNLQSIEVKQVSIGETATNSAPFEILFKNRPQGSDWTRDDVLNLDIVICLIGPQIGECMIGSDFVTTGTNWSRIAQLRIKEKELSIEYLMAWLTNGDFKAQVERLAGGTVLRAISKKDLNRIVIPIPTLQVQASIGAISNQVETLDKATQDIAELNSQMNLSLKVLLSVLLAMIAKGQ
jgi:restriction endonuclease S subunit